MVPTVRLAATRVVVATGCAKPTTLGTGTGAGPSDTTRVTALPGSTGVPAPGLWLTTLPAATVVLLTVVMAPTARLAADRVAAATDCAKPTTLGTGTGAGPSDTTRVTALPGSTGV